MIHSSLGLLALAAPALLLLAACGGEPVPFELSSPAFANGAPIPIAYTGEGQDVSPPLVWTGVPEGTEQLLLVVEDPDAPTPQPWIHWVLANLRPDLPGLAEGSDGGGSAATNSFRKLGYGGPMPPPGHGPHRYVFTLYALDFWVDLPAGGFTLHDLQRGPLAEHTLGTAELVGTYERK